MDGIDRKEREAKAAFTAVFRAWILVIHLSRGPHHTTTTTLMGEVKEWNSGTYVLVGKTNSTPLPSEQTTKQQAKGKRKSRRKGKSAKKLRNHHQSQSISQLQPASHYLTVINEYIFCHKPANIKQRTND